MYCSQCGSPNPDKNNFCGDCGARLAKIPAPVFAEPVSVSGSSKSADIREIAQKPLSTQANPHIEPVTFRHQEVRPEEPERAGRAEPTTISGPSFLGLTDSPESEQTSYLLDEDQPRRRGGWFAFAIIMIGIFVGIGYLEWNNIKTGRLNIPFINPVDSEPQTRTAPAPIINGNAQGTATPQATPQPGSAGNDTKFTTAESDAAKTDAAHPVADATITSRTQPAQTLAPAANAEPDSTAATPDASAHHQANEDGTPVAGALAKSSPSRSAVKSPALTENSDPRQNKMLLLGEKYLYGRGAPQSCNQALVYFKAAADEGNGPAMSHLGAMYASGNCVTLNRVTAFQWLARAQNAEPTDQWLQRNMNMLWRDMTPDERAAINR